MINVLKAYSAIKNCKGNGVIRLSNYFPLTFFVYLFLINVILFMIFFKNLLISLFKYIT